VSAGAGKIRDSPHFVGATKGTVRERRVLVEVPGVRSVVSITPIERRRAPRVGVGRHGGHGERRHGGSDFCMVCLLRACKTDGSREIPLRHGNGLCLLTVTSL
jgi:hypothetical protein